MLADDLVSVVALDAFGARVPSGNVSRRIQHEDRVITYGLNDQAKSFFALSQCLFRRASFREIARDLGEAEEFPVVVAERRDDDVGPKARSVFPNSPSFVLEAPIRF